MRRMNFHALAVALALAAVPAASQNFSESYNYLKGVRERDGAAVTAIVATPNPAVVNARDTSTGEGALHILVRGRDLTWLGFIISKGARVDLQNNDGATPLSLAAQLDLRRIAHATPFRIR